MTNLLALPLVSLAVETGNNEDWVDSLLFLVETDGVPIESWPQLDLTGIIFEMEVRRSALDPEVIVAASTASGSLIIGTAPDYGYLLFNVSIDDMRRIRAGQYIADVIGRDDLNTRVVIRMDLAIVEGITKQPVNKRVIVQAEAA
jgi:hypothetical protein